MCEHHWADISAHENVGKQRIWLCTKCGERAATDWGGPFDLPAMRPQQRPMSDAELIAALERKPYDRASREAVGRLRELLGMPPK